MGFDLIQSWYYKFRDTSERWYGVVRGALAFAGLLTLLLEICLLIFKTSYNPAWWLFVLNCLGYGVPFVIITVYGMLINPHPGDRRPHIVIGSRGLLLMWPVIAVTVLYLGLKKIITDWKEAAIPGTIDKTEGILNDPVKLSVAMLIFVMFNFITASGSGGLYAHHLAFVLPDYLFPGAIFTLATERIRRRRSNQSVADVSAKTAVLLVFKWLIWLPLALWTVIWHK